MSYTTKEKILEAALELFAAYGFTAVKTKAIAEKAGVNEVTLFRIFGSKKNIYSETVRRYLISPTPEFLLAGVGYNPEEDLHKISRAIITLFLKNSGIIKMSFKELASFDEIDQELKRQPEDMIRVVAGYLADMKNRNLITGDPENLARHFVTIIYGTVFHFIHHDMVNSEYSLDKCISDFVNFFSCCLIRNRSTRNRDFPKDTGNRSGI